MSVIYFDTETTGLVPGQICQLAYLIEDASGLLAKNYYFSVDYVEPSAAAVTGLTVPRLIVLSGGEVIGSHLEEIEEDFCSATALVAHNFNFDCNFMRAEFERHSRVFRVREKFCTMREFTPRMKLPSPRGCYKYPTLEEFASCYGVSSLEAQRLTNELFDAETNAHDARYDTCKMYLALKNARRFHADIDQFFKSRT